MESSISRAAGQRSYHPVPLYDDKGKEADVPPPSRRRSTGEFTFTPVRRRGSAPGLLDPHSSPSSPSSPDLEPGFPLRLTVTDESLPLVANDAFAGDGHGENVRNGMADFAAGRIALARLVAACIATEQTHWGSRYESDKPFRKKVDGYMALRCLAMKRIATGTLDEGTIQTIAQELGFALGHALGLLDEGGEFTSYAVNALKSAQHEYVQSSIANAFTTYVPAAGRSLLYVAGQALGAPLPVLLGLNAAYVAYDIWNIYASAMWTAQASNTCIAGQVMSPFAELPDHSSSELIKEDRSKGTLRIPANVKRDIEIVDAYLSLLALMGNDEGACAPLKARVSEDLATLQMRMDELRRSPGAAAETDDVVMVLELVLDAEGAVMRDAQGRERVQPREVPAPPGQHRRMLKTETGLRPDKRLAMAALKERRGVYLQILGAIEQAQASGTAPDLAAIRGGLTLELVCARLWATANVSKAMSRLRAERAAGVAAATSVSSLLGAGLSAGGLISEPVKWGLEAAGGLITLGVPFWYAARAQTDGWHDYATKVKAQLAARALSGPGNFHRIWDDPDSGIDLKRLGAMTRPPLRTRCQHWADTVAFDVRVWTLALVSKFVRPASTVTLEIAALGDQPQVVERSADRLFVAFCKCATPASRRLMMDTLLDDDAGAEDIEHRRQAAEDILAGLEALKVVEKAAREGRLDTVLESKLIHEDGKQTLLGSLQYAIACTPGTPDEVVLALRTEAARAADKTLQENKGITESQSRANAQTQAAQNFGKQYSNVFAGTASPALIKSATLICEGFMQVFGVSPQALDALVAASGFVTVAGQIINLGTGFAYHKYISRKNMDRQRNKDSDIAEMPNAGHLQLGERDFFQWLWGFNVQETQGFRTLYSRPVPHVGIAERVAFDSEIDFFTDARTQMFAVSWKKWFAYFDKPAGQVTPILDFEATMQAYEAELEREAARVLGAVPGLDLVNASARHASTFEEQSGAVTIVLGDDAASMEEDALSDAAGGGSSD